MPPEQRRQLLALKFITKIMAIKRHPIIGILDEKEWRINLIMNNGILDENKPYLINSLAQKLPYMNKIHKSRNFPCYTIDYDTLISPLQVVKCNINKQDPEIKIHFREIQNKYKNIHIFFFHRRLKKINRTGMDIHIPQLNYNFMSRLPDNISICQAEIIAIDEAIKTARHKQLQNHFFRFSKINTNLLNSKIEYWTLKTKELIYSVNQVGYDYRIAWIPGHAGITGNATADILANTGRTLNIPKNISFNAQEFANKIKVESRNTFQNNWKQ